MPFCQRLETGRFVWPSPADGKVTITPPQLVMLLEGIRRKRRETQGAVPYDAGVANHIGPRHARVAARLPATG